MLDMGFIPDIEFICSKLPEARQTMLFSATMPPPIEKLAKKFLNNPKRIEVSRAATTNKDITAFKVPVKSRQKRETLRWLLNNDHVETAIIFANRKTTVRELNKSLQRHGFRSGEIHGDMDQSNRLKELDRFKAGEINILVASDVAARGLDIKGVSHVFNFDVPSNPEDYVHRIGRTGRAGSEGRALTLATPEDARYLANIVKLIGGEIPPFQVAGVDSAADPAPAPKTRGRRAKSEGEKSPETSLETKPESGKTSGKRGRGSERKRGAERGRNGERTPAPLPDDGGTVIGFGSEMPAFMRNPVNVSNK